jgi:hypothetical protein
MKERHMRIVTLIRISLLMLCVALYAAQSMAQSNDGGRGIPDSFSKGFGCLISQTWAHDDLGELGLKPGERARVVYRTGSIPGLSPASSNTTNVLVLASDVSRGWLLFFRTEADGGVTALRNGYRIRHTSEGWSAEEGNGGIATYKAISDYVAQLAKGHILKVVLKPASDNCRVDN